MAITDIDFTDLYYQYSKRPKSDTNIVIVNIGYQDRASLAGILKIISENNPKVIAADIFFAPDLDSIDIIGTSLLAFEIEKMQNLVLAGGYLMDENGQDYKLRQSPLVKNVKEGIVSFNIATDDPEYGTVRSFEPIKDIGGVKYLSFGFLIGSMLDSMLLEKAYEGDMMIKWYGYGARNLLSDSTSVFKTFDWSEIQKRQFHKADLENKIVLLGFMGERIGIYSQSDQFFTPLNEKIIGRSFADMYAVEIHANIIKMILERDFIHHTRTADYVFNLLFIILLTITLFWIQRKYEKQYSIVSKVALIIYVDLLVIGTICIFLWTQGGVKFLIGDGLFVMLFLPDIYEFLEGNIFNRFSKVGDNKANPTLLK